MRKRILSFVLVLCVLSTLITTFPYTASAETSGTCGDNLTWILDNQGTLTISGNGKLSSNDEYNCFSSHKDDVYSLVLDSGITGVTGLYFSLLSNMESLYLSDTFSFADNEYTMENAIGNCKSLCEIFVDANNKELCSIDGVLYNKDLTKLLRVPRCKNVIYDIPVSVVKIGDKASYKCNNLDSVYYAGSEDDWNNISIGSSNECLTNAILHYSESNNVINVSNINDLQSEHPYSNNEDTTWVYTHPSEAETLQVTFSNDTETESGYDFIYIYDKFDNLIGEYSGTELAGKTISISGNVVKIQLTSDGSETRNGFTLSAITANAYVLTYDANGGSGEPNAQIKNKGKNITLSVITPLREGYNFIGWATTSGALVAEYEPGATFSNDVNTTLYAVWERKVIISSSGTCGENITWTLDSDGILTISGNGEMYNYSWSNSPWYSEKDDIKVVNICDGIKSIGNCAFSECSNLENITIPKSVLNISKTAFYECNNLEIDVDNENKVFSSVDGVLFDIDKTTIIRYAKSKKSPHYTIPEGVKIIDEYAFSGDVWGYGNLGSISIPNGVEIISSHAFYGTDIKQLTIPDSVTMIGESAFERCDYLTSIYIPDSVTHIGDSAFYLCTQIEYVTIGNGVKDIGNAAFGNCSKLSNVIVGENVVNIDAGSFYDCPNLSEVTWNAKEVMDVHEGYIFSNVGTNLGEINVVFGENVKRIPNNLFRENITNVYIPRNVSFIGQNTFGNSGKCQINVDDNNLIYSSINGVLFNKDKTKLIRFAQDEIQNEYIIPDSVIEIADGAFQGCALLEEITIGENVVNIGEKTFSGCITLKQINWNATRMQDISYNNYIFENAGTKSEGISIIFGDNVEYIPSYVFYNMSQIISVNIGEYVRRIGKYAFYGCSGLTDVMIPDNVEFIGERAFYNCVALIQINWNALSVKDFSYDDLVFGNAGKESNGITVVFGENVERIPEYIFYGGNSNIISIKSLGKNIKEIDSSLFEDTPFYSDEDNWTGDGLYIDNCLISVKNSIEGHYEIKEGTCTIAGNAFDGCENLTSVTIPNSVISIGESAFNGCSQLTDIVLPSELLNIGDYAFGYCDGITTITIPDSVTSIGNGAFYKCTNLSKISISNSVISIGCDLVYGTQYYNNESNWDNDALYIDKHLIKVKSTATENYSIRFNTQTIAGEAFYNCNKLATIEIPNSVISIGYGAFRNCSSLTTINIPEDVVYIGEYAFGGCEAITTVTIPNGVTSIADGLFSECSQLSTVNFPENIIDIGEYAFDGCSSLLNISIPCNMDEIKESTFSDCSSLRSISIPNNISFIRKNAFYGCSNLTEIIIPNGVVEIEDRAFANCTAAQLLIIPESVKSVGNSAFNNLLNLEEIKWNAIDIDSYPTTGNSTKNSTGAFYRAGINGTGVCVTFGDDVISIPANTFCAIKDTEKNIKLKKVVFSKNIKTIGDNAFAYCDELEELTLPQYVTSLGSGIIYNTSVKEIRIPNTVTNVSKVQYSDIGTLSGTNLTTVTLENGMREIPFGGYNNEYSIFAYANVENIVLPASIKTITNISSSSRGGICGAFNDCQNLNSIIVDKENNKFNSVDGVLFEKMSNGQLSLACYPPKKAGEFTIPTNVQYISAYACSRLELDSLIVPDSVAYIGEYAFYRCDNLKRITMPKSITTIENGLFYVCDNLEEIYISDNIYCIEDNAFVLCSNLKDVYYTGSESDWNNISIWQEGNDVLSNVTIHYNYRPETDDEDDKLVVNEERYKEITFHVVGYPEDEIVFEGEPVENATVTFRGASKKTDESGNVTFYKDEFSAESGGVSVTADGYWDYDASEIWVMPFDGVDTISLTKKNPEKIYITNLYVSSTTGEKYDLKIRNDFSVDKTDTSAYKFRIDVDWNNHEAGKVYLKGDKSGKSFEFVNGEVSISPGVEFEVGENIKVVVYTADETKSATEENLINVIALPEEFSLVIPQVIDDTMSTADFMVGKSFQIGIDTGIEKFAEKVDVVDGKLVIEFFGSIGEGSSSKKKGRFEIFDGKYIEVEPHGKIELPLTIDNSEWSGAFGVDGKADPIVEYDWNKWVYIPGVGYIPVTATVKFSGGVSSELELSGGMDKVSFDGKISPSLTLDAFGGLGVDYDTVEMKAGVYLNAKGELEIVCHALDPESEFNPSLAGEVGVRAKVKVWILEVEGEEEAGKFRWDKEGFKATWFGDDVGLFSLRNDSWQLSGREYLENGGGFIGGNNIALFDLEVTNKDEQIIYNNIFDNAEAVLQNINDNTLLVYTIDDIERKEQNGLKLVYSEKLDDGTWSDPITIDDDGTLDSIISADEKFVVWEDMKSELSDPSMQMKDILAQTEISVAYYDGENWISTQLTSNDIYDFSPTIKTNRNIAIATWLSNTESDFTSQSGTTNIHYATFDGTNWSEITTIENVGTVTRVTSAYNGDTPYIFYKKDGVIYSVSAMDGTTTTLSYSGVGQYAIDTFNDKIVLAYFDANGNLKVSDDVLNSSVASTVTTEAEVNSIPVIATNNTDMYIGWIDHQNGYDTLCGVRYENGVWSDKITFIGEEANVSNPSLIANDDGTFSASYFKTGKVEISESGEYTTGEVNLFVNNISPSYNIAIDNETLTYNDAIYAKGNVAAITFDVKNVGEKSVSGFDVEIYENDELKKTISKTSEIRAGATESVHVSYVPTDSGKIQELQIKVVPIDADDFDESDNIATISLGTVDATVTSAYFTKEGRTNYVNAVIRNNGSVTADKIVVSIRKGSQDGEILYQTDIEDVLSYEELLVKTEISANNLADTSLFYVMVEAQNDVNMYNNNAIAVKNNGGYVEKETVTFDRATNTATIKSEKEYKDAVVFFATYNNGRLVSLKKVDKDLIAGENTATPEDFSLDGADTVKVMVWESSSNIKPLFEACVVELE